MLLQPVNWYRVPSSDSKAREQPAHDACAEHRVTIGAPLAGPTSPQRSALDDVLSSYNVYKSLRDRRSSLVQHEPNLHRAQAILRARAKQVGAAEITMDACLAASVFTFGLFVAVEVSPPAGAFITASSVLASACFCFRINDTLQKTEDLIPEPGPKFDELDDFINRYRYAREEEINQLTNQWESAAHALELPIATQEATVRHAWANFVAAELRQKLDDDTQKIVMDYVRDDKTSIELLVEGATQEYPVASDATQENPFGPDAAQEDSLGPD